jgi:leucyl-tRNA synthetase
MISPICPHIGEEIWEILGHNNTIAYESWPTFDEAKTADDTVEMVVQINGKLKGKINVAKDTDKDEVLALAKADEKVAEAISGKTIVKEIVVPNKIVNIVVK